MYIINFINGCFFLGDLKNFNESYYFSKLNSSWGWATWKESWEHFDSKMTGYKDAIGIRLNKEVSKQPASGLDYLDFGSVQPLFSNSENGYLKIMNMTTITPNGNGNELDLSF